MNIDPLLAKLPVERFRNPAPVIGVVRLNGTIGGRGALSRPGLTLAELAGPLQAAFGLKHLKAVALVINSPGGAPAQTSLIFRRIRQWADEKEVPVFAFVEDVAASGGYWLALAADEIYADESSIVGSIGVITASFGVNRLIERWGIERRLYTQGEHKSMLDPFRPEDPDDVARLKAIQSEMFETFTDRVRTRREGRLKAPENELFTGDIWTGKRALELGLIDGIGEIRQVLRSRFGEKVRLRAVGERKSWIRRRLGMSGSMSGGMAGLEPERWLAALDERLIWSRFGL
jgi:signal peptide peptidase SppA